jgi:hypothetical protein
MSLAHFRQQVKNHEAVSFAQTIAIITENYIYQPTEFSNGLNEAKLINEAGTNEGSCKIFAFAQINQLSQQQTLNLFGDFYKKDVLDDPAGNGHQNIRNFMQFSWDGIHFSQQALVAK